MVQKLNFQSPLLKFSIHRNIIVVVFLFLSTISLQAQMFIGKDAVLTLEGSSSMTSDTIIIASGSKTKKDFTVKKSGKLYVVTGNTSSENLSENSAKLAKNESKACYKKKKEFLGEEKSKRIIRADIPNPKPQISYTSTSTDNFNLKAEQRLLALAGNPLPSGKKAVLIKIFKDKTITFISNLGEEKHATLFLDNSPLSIYLNSFRSRPPPFLAFS